MDIQVASNFERYLYYLFGESPARVRSAFTEFAGSGRMSFTDVEMAQVREDFISRTVTEDETIATIASFHRETGYLLDPHTAVGVKAALACCGKGETLVCLATAHPAKFDEAVQKATGIAPPYPEVLAGIEKLPTRCAVLDNDQAAIRAFIEEKAN
jgi:threonine synthase